MKHCALAALVAAFIVVVTAPAQVIQVAPATEVARETDPKRFSEPHLAIHPTNSKHLLAAIFISWVQGALEEIRAHERCAAFVFRDRGATWNRLSSPWRVALIRSWPYYPTVKLYSSH